MSTVFLICLIHLLLRSQNANETIAKRGSKKKDVTSRNSKPTPLILGVPHLTLTWALPFVLLTPPNTRNGTNRQTRRNGFYHTTLFKWFFHPQFSSIFLDLFFPRFFIFYILLFVLYSEFVVFYADFSNAINDIFHQSSKTLFSFVFFFSVLFYILSITTLFVDGW